MDIGGSSFQVGCRTFMTVELNVIHVWRAPGLTVGVQYKHLFISLSVS